jgi:hypothetical protein
VRLGKQKGWTAMASRSIKRGFKPPERVASRCPQIVPLRYLVRTGNLQFVVCGARSTNQSWYRWWGFLREVDNSVPLLYSTVFGFRY